MRTRHAVVLLVAAWSLAARAQSLAGPTVDGAGSGVRVNANGGVTVDDAALGFKLVLPKGAQVVPGAMKDDLAYVFSVGPAEDATTVAIQRLGKRIAREFSAAEAAKLKPKLPAGITLVPGEWRGLKLMVLRVEQATPQGPFLDYGAGIPLLREGIQLHVAGPRANDEKLKKLLADLLLVLTGEPAK
jgi:hypothetical protein